MSQLKHFLLLITVTALAACSSTYSDRSITQQTIKPTPTKITQSADALTKLANSATTEDAPGFRLEAAELYFKANKIAHVKTLLQSLEGKVLTPEQSVRKKLLKAELALNDQKPNTALSLLKTIPNQNYPQATRLKLYETAAKAHVQRGNLMASVKQRVQLDTLLRDPTKRAANQKLIWEDLNQLSAKALRDQARNVYQPTLKAWVKLAYINQAYHADSRAWLQALHQWQQQYPQHPGQHMLRGDAEKLKALAFPEEVKKVALLLPLTGPLKGAATAIKEGIMTAYFQASQAGHQPPTIQVFDTQNEQNVLGIYQRAVQSGADIVIGPLSKQGVYQFASKSDLPVPVLALNSVPDSHHDKLIQFGLTPEEEATMVARKAWADGHRRSLILVPKSTWGNRLLRSFRNEWSHLGGSIADIAQFESQGDLAKSVKHVLDIDQSQARAKALRSVIGRNIRTEPRRRSDADLIFLAASPAQARQIKPLLSFYFASRIPVYAPPTVYSGFPDRAKDHDMNGIYFCDMPWLLSNQPTISELRTQIRKQWPRHYSRHPRLFGFGIDAFQLATKINRLATFPQMGYPGVTGTLSLDQDNRVQRQLVWAKFSKGTPSLVRNG